MKAVNVQLDEAMIPDIAKLLKQRLKKARAEVKAIQIQLRALNRPKPVKETAAVAVKRPVDEALEAATASSGDVGMVRVSRVDVENQILGRLRELNGSGVGMSKLRRDLGTKHSTTFRALQSLRERNLVVNEDNRWRLLDGQREFTSSLKSS